VVTNPSGITSASPSTPTARSGESMYKNNSAIIWISLGIVLVSLLIWVVVDNEKIKTSHEEQQEERLKSFSDDLVDHFQEYCMNGVVYYGSFLGLRSGVFAPKYNTDGTIALCPVE